MKEGQHTMYRVGHRITRHYAWYAAGAVLLLLIPVVAIAAVYKLAQPDTTITQSPAVVRHVPAAEAADVHVTIGIVAMDLPAGWELITQSNAPSNAYSWHGTASPTDQQRQLDVYVDQSMDTLAVNRLLPVAASGAGLQLTGTTSDNCVNFTDKIAGSAQSGKAPSKWGGVNFLCDIGNYERDVVAIGSPDGLNTVVLMGATSGRHHVLLVYTDNSPSPDYAMFAAIVRSFHLL